MKRLADLLPLPKTSPKDIRQYITCLSFESKRDLAHWLYLALVRGEFFKSMILAGFMGGAFLGVLLAKWAGS